MNIRRELLENLIAKNYSQQRIADTIGVTKGKVIYALRFYGLKTIKKINRCKKCKKVLKGSIKVYCDNTCQNAYQNDSYIDRWLEGLEKGWVAKTKKLSITIRNYLKKVRGSNCEECGWDEQHPLDGKSLTEIDHIDGDAENCRPENLKILCPNCHSMTPTYRNRNKRCTRSRY